MTEPEAQALAALNPERYYTSKGEVYELISTVDGVCEGCAFRDRGCRFPENILRCGVFSIWIPVKLKPSSP